MAKLRIAGVWSGSLDVDLEQWTVPMLREEIARKVGPEAGPQTINLIFGGKVLKDGDGTQRLGPLGLKNNSKVLASRASSADQGKELVAEEERDNRLSRIKAAVTSMATRHADGLLPAEDFNMELENQSGEKVQLGSETDQRAVMMGLMLHANSKPLVRKGKYKEALELLTMGEESFSLCSSKAIELIDNVPILQIDMVWCYFMLRDISWLSVAGMRLSKARQGLERAHGKELSRLRLLQGGCFPEIALHMRLELLEGVVAYHSGQLEKSQQCLTSAQTKYFKLQVPDEALSMLMGMGYKQRDSKRALRMSNQDIGSAVEFLFQEAEKKAQKREEDLRHQREIMEQRQYGVTPLRKPVDLQMLSKLTLIGYEKELAAEALRRHENDFQKALDDLTDTEANSKIQLYIESRKRKRMIPATNAAAAGEQLISTDYPRDGAMETVHPIGAGNETLANIGNNFSLDGGEGSSNVNRSSSDKFEEERDVEMEEQLAEELYKTDAFSDYDIEVTREGEAINEYLAMLDSTEKGITVSSSHY